MSNDADQKEKYGEKVRYIRWELSNHTFYSSSGSLCCDAVPLLVHDVVLVLKVYAID